MTAVPRTRRAPPATADRQAVPEFPRIASHCRLLDEHELAAWLGLSVKTLRNWRVRGGHIAFIRLGRKAVRYREADVMDWLQANTRSSTSGSTK
jgi:excisionase family DNA binding protein